MKLSVRVEEKERWRRGREGGFEAASSIGQDWMGLLELDGCSLGHGSGQCGAGE